MRYALLLLIVPSLLLGGCTDDTKVGGWDVDEFRPHRATDFTVTPAGHMCDAGPFSSVVGGFVTEAEIHAAVDAGFAQFVYLFPELVPPNPRVHLTEDYVFWYGGTWAAGASEGGDVLVCLFSRGTSTGDPGAEYKKRAPDQNYGWWRFTVAPLCPGLTHELLHCVIGDPYHMTAWWGRLA